MSVQLVNHFVIAMFLLCLQLVNFLWILNVSHVCTVCCFFVILMFLVSVQLVNSYVV